MYFLYVDESGDTGTSGSPTPYFSLSGLVLHELVWHRTLERIIDFRRFLRTRYNLKLRQEIHAAAFIHKPGDLVHIAKSMRLRILREVLDFEATLPDVNVINVVVDKQGKAPGFDVFEHAWKLLFQRFHNTISYRNFPGPQNPQDYGIAIVDQTSEKQLRILLRRLRRYNPVPHAGGIAGYRDIPLITITEDPVHRNSAHSYFVQLSDVNAYFLYQKKCQACKYVQRQGARNYFVRLDPILCKVASRTDPHGVVWG